MKLPIYPAALIACACLAGGCSVRLPMKTAVAERLTDAEVRHLEESGQGASVPGTWFLMEISLPRESLRKIATWQLYTHIRVKDCRSGETVSVISSAEVDQAGTDFDKMEELLDDRERSLFGIGGSAFVPAGRSLDNLCVQLEGGSYTLQKISSEQIPLRVALR